MDDGYAYQAAACLDRQRLHYASHRAPVRKPCSTTGHVSQERQQSSFANVRIRLLDRESDAPPNFQ